MQKDKKLVEAALFIAGHEMKREELAEMLQMSPEQIEKLVTELTEDYSKRDSAITIVKLTNSYKMDIKGQYLDHVKTMAPDIELSRGVLKALSFIAYKQPVKQSELVHLMGNRAYEYVHELVDRAFITAERYGRTRLLNTTEKFQMYFGKGGLTEEDTKHLDIPPPEEIKIEVPEDESEGGEPQSEPEAAKSEPDKQEPAPEPEPDEPEPDEPEPEPDEPEPDEPEPDSPEPEPDKPDEPEPYEPDEPEPAPEPDEPEPEPAPEPEEKDAQEA